LLTLRFRQVFIPRSNLGVDLGQFASGLENNNAAVLDGDQFVARLPPAVTDGV
jgi:hypothetical protein